MPYAQCEEENIDRDKPFVIDSDIADAACIYTSRMYWIPTSTNIDSFFLFKSDMDYAKCGGYWIRYKSILIS